MGFISFIGRVLFASVFILSAWQEFNEFGVDGGPAAKALRPKFDVLTNHVTSNLGVQVPEIEIKHLVAGAVALKGIGGIFFIFGSCFGAYLLLYISCLLLLFYTTFTTTTLTRKNLFSFLSSLHRTWRFLGHCSFS
uniref:HR-like lesion-inducer n=1 Tax=Nelumbo nucifera TaxID=4432 RepID=A0A822YRB8_NELNU|nr:TPA_asm: hypothetical protein HUJ06_007385 [Nelumbo nucifera]